MDDILINNAFDRLFAQTGIEAEYLPNPINPNEILDGVVNLLVNNETIQFNAVVKNQIREHHLGKLMYLHKNFYPLLIITKKIFPKLKVYFEEEGIAYLEENGNFFAKTPGNYFLIKGNKTNPQRHTPINRAFTKTGIRVLFQFLVEPELVNAPYRVIADYAGVAVGNITYVKNGLRELGYLVQVGHQIEQLVNVKELFNKWIDGYINTLKPALHVQNYRFVRDQYFEQWETLQLNQRYTAWGGEPAGNLLTEYLRPEILTIYTSEPQRELMRNYRMVPEMNGNIEVYEKFWTNNFAGDPIAHPLIVYADLLSTGEARCIEIAEIIYKEIIDEHIQNIS